MTYKIKFSNFLTSDKHLQNQQMLNQLFDLKRKVIKSFSIFFCLVSVSLPKRLPEILTNSEVLQEQQLQDANKDLRRKV
jgi:hypothetical protein